MEGYAAYPYVEEPTFGKASQNVSVGAGWASRAEAAAIARLRPSILVNLWFGWTQLFFVRQLLYTFATNEDFISSFNLVSIAYRYSGKSFSLDLGIVLPLTEELEYTVTRYSHGLAFPCRLANKPKLVR